MPAGLSSRAIIDTGGLCGEVVAPSNDEELGTWTQLQVGGEKRRLDCPACRLPPARLPSVGERSTFLSWIAG